MKHELSMRKRLLFILLQFSILHINGQYRHVYDIDGNKYKVVNYGSQQWMQENMRATRDHDGNSFVKDNFSDPNIPTYFMPDSNEALVPAYGLLYNWEAAQKVCPEGWRLPSDEDWRELVLYLSHDEKNCCVGNPQNLAKSMSAAISNWHVFEEIEHTECSVCIHPENNNASGFCAYPAGMCTAEYYDYLGWWHNYLGVHSNSLFWSATHRHNYHYAFQIADHDVSLGFFPKNDGLSVRCVKDRPNVKKVFCPADNVLPMPVPTVKDTLNYQCDGTCTCSFTHAQEPDTLFLDIHSEYDVIVWVHADILVSGRGGNQGMKAVNVSVPDIINESDNMEIYHYKNGEFIETMDEGESEIFYGLHSFCYVIWLKYVDLFSKKEFYLPSDAPSGIYSLNHAFRLRIRSKQ